MKSLPAVFLDYPNQSNILKSSFVHFQEVATFPNVLKEEFLESYQSQMNDDLELNTL